MYIKQISVFVENRAGRLAEVTQVLEREGIDIRALSIADTTDYGILRLIVSDPDAAVKAFRKANMMVSATDVIGIKVPDVPGGFSKAVRALADGEIGIEYAYAFITPDGKNACVIIRVEDNDIAAEVLKKAGIGLISEKDAFNR